MKAKMPCSSSFKMFSKILLPFTSMKSKVTCLGLLVTDFTVLIVKDIL